MSTKFDFPLFDNRDLKEKIIAHADYIPTLRDLEELDIIEECVNKFVRDNYLKLVFNIPILEQIIRFIEKHEHSISIDIENTIAIDNTDADELWQDDYSAIDVDEQVLIIVLNRLYKRLSSLAAAILIVMYEIRRGLIHNGILKAELYRYIKYIKPPRSQEERFAAYRSGIMKLINDFTDAEKIEIVAEIINSIPDIEDPNNKMIKRLEEKVTNANPSNAINIQNI